MKTITFASCLLAVALAFIPQISTAQITNGSFENPADTGDLTGWVLPCPIFNAPKEDAPPGGGNWCYRTVSENFNACYPGYTIQVMDNVYDQEIITVKGWLKAIPGVPFLADVGIFFGSYDPSDDDFTPCASATVPSSLDWIELMVEDTIFVLPGEQPAVALYPGFTSGPIGNPVYFDEISVVGPSTTPTGLAHAEPISSANVFPNPFSQRVTIELQEPVAQNVEIEVRDILGRQIGIDLVSADSYRLVLDGASLTTGIYTFQVMSNGRLHAKGLMVAE